VSESGKNGLIMAENGYDIAHKIDEFEQSGILCDSISEDRKDDRYDHSPATDH
jgi:hypothetical protein